MKTLLIFSQNINHIAIIDNNSNESLLDTLNAYINDKEESLKDYIIEQTKEKAFFVESGEKPRFDDLIEENEIQFIVTYYKDIQRAVFAIKSNDKFYNFDLKDYINKNSIEDFYNLIKEQSNARATFRLTNEENNEENRRRERQTIQRETRGRTENRLFRESNAEARNADEQGGIREEQGISKSSTGIRQPNRIAGEAKKDERGNEQRGGLEEEKFPRPIYTQASQKDNSADSQKEPKTIFDRRSIQAKNIAGNDRLSTQEAKKSFPRNDKFKTRIESLLQRGRINTAINGLLFLRNRRDSRDYRGEEFSDSKLSNPRTHLQNRVHQGRLQSSGKTNRGIEEPRHIGNNRDGDNKGRNVNRPPRENGTIYNRLEGFEQSSSGANATSTNNQQELNSIPRANATILSDGSNGLDSFGVRAKQKESNIENVKQELVGNENRETNTGNKQISEFGIGEQSQDLYDSNGILQEQSGGQNQKNESYRKDDSAKNVRENNILQQNLSQTQKSLFEDTEILQGERTQAYEHIKYGRALDEAMQIEKQNSMANRNSNQSFKIFDKYEFIKKLDGEEYKGEIDFNLSKKQRIEANFNALYLIKKIFERKEKVNRVDLIDDNELLDFIKNQNLNAGNEEEYYKKFQAEKLIEIEKEYKELNYFSLDCPYNKAEQEILAKYSGFGGLKDLFYDESYKEQREKLLGLVGQEFYDEMKFSSYNAYYTPNAIIEAMYSGLSQLGVPNNEVVTALEPSCGIGHFITKAPPNYQFIAIEKDSLSATIAKLLHPKTTIYNESYESVMFNREFDVIIGNPPYENEKAENSKALIHNYFVLKSQDLLKNGGLSSFVITAGFMDSKNNFHREQLMENSVMLSAFRLPNSAFKNTHTEVLSDIVFLGKLNDKTKFVKDNKNKFEDAFLQLNSNGEKFLKSIEKFIDDEKSLKINNYFDYYTDNILGSSEIVINQFGEYSLKVKEYEDETLTSLIREKIKENLQNPTFSSPNFVFYDKTPAFKAEEISISELNLLPSELRYVNSLKIGNIFEYDNTFYTKEENYTIREVCFEDELELSKKYLLGNKKILKENKANLIYQNPLSVDEKEILRKIIAFRDLLNENLTLERYSDNSEESNTKILKQKTQLRELRTNILQLSQTKGFNVNRARNKKENDIVIKHTLKKLIELEKLENYKIFATENVIKIPKNKGFDYRYEEADILQKRVLFKTEKTQAKDSKEALQKTINEKGYIHLETLQSYLPNIPLENTIKDLLEKELIFPDLSQKRKYCLKNEFLSGNIKAKAHYVEQMIKHNDSFQVEALETQRYLEILKENFPKDIPYEDLEINFGANFIKLDIYKEFIRQSFFKNPQEIDVIINVENGEYLIESFRKKNGIFSNNDYNDLGQQLKVNDNSGKVFFSLRRLLEHTINNKSLEVHHQKTMEDGRKKKVVERDNTQQALRNADYIKGLFSDFVFKHKEYRDSIQEQYNKQINVFSKAQFEFEDMLETPYLNKDISLRLHQKNAIFKGILQNSLMIDHQVGAGKTLVGIVLAMEQIRMNLIKKALILVPNHLSTSWGIECIRAYHNAKILVGDNIDSKKARKEFLYRARNGDFDVIVMKHSTFENMNVMESFQREVLSNQLNNYEQQLINLMKEKGKINSDDNEKEDKRIKAYIEKKIYYLKKKLEKQAKGKTYDNEIAFEDLGIDCLIVDEAHNFKNLFISTTQENIRGIPTQESKKAMKMYCATQYCHENNFKLYFLTGTPVSNSIAEFYTMQRFLQPDILKELKLENFDDWQKAFTNISLNEELDSSGVNYALVSRLSSFINAPELMNFYKQNADIVTTDDIEKISGRLVPKVKGGKAINIVAPRSEAIANFIGIEDEFGNFNKGSIIDRMNRVSEDPKRNNILVCTSEARKATLDFRLIDPNALDYEDSKVNKMIDLIKEHYDDNRYEKNTQLVFCDLGVSKKKSKDIDVNADDFSVNESIEDIAKRLELELKIDYDDDGNEITRYYVEYEKDENNKFVYEEYKDENGKAVKEKVIKRTADIAELLNEQTKFDLYADILKKLVKKGIPQNQIAFIGDAQKDKEKEALFEKVNNGDIRILIGSTAKMGTGTNVQQRIVAMHELDCPWKPAELEQRAGRGIRQGNMFFEKDKENFEIAHYRYATEQTYDARMFQINEQKLKPLIQMKKANILDNQRIFQGIDEEMTNIADMKAIATGNPFIIEKHKIDNLLKTEESYEQYYKKSIISNENSLQIEQMKLPMLQNEVEALREMFNNKNFLQENYEFEMLGVKSTKKPLHKVAENKFKNQREEIENKIWQLLMESKNDKEEKTINFFKGNDVEIKFYIKTNGEYINFNGAIITQNNKIFYPKNLIFNFRKDMLYHTEFTASSFLTRVKNTFEKVSMLLENKTRELQECKDSIQDRQRFLKNNTINTYERKFFIDILKQDSLNMSGIFAIKNQKRKEGVKIDMQSEEIKHLLPQYPKFLDGKGRLLDSKIIEFKEKSLQKQEKTQNELKNQEQISQIATPYSLLDIQLSQIDKTIPLQSFEQEDKLEEKIAILNRNQNNITNAKRARSLL